MDQKIVQRMQDIVRCAQHHAYGLVIHPMFTEEGLYVALQHDLKVLITGKIPSWGVFTKDTFARMAAA